MACEESQAVCKAFRDRGFEAFSCDIEPCSGGHPEWHFQEDIFEVLKREPRFDLMIAHPPCTHLAVSGMRWFKEGVTRDDGFVWLIVPREKVRGLWETGTFTLYRLYADDSEAEIENKEQLEETLERGYSVGIEVGFVATMGYAARMHR